LGWVTVTHPFHPLRGQQVEVVRIRSGADPDLIVRHPDGRHAAIAVDWTDYAALPDIDPPPIPPNLLDFDGLWQAAQLIERIRREGRVSGPEDTNRTCASSGDRL